MEVVGNMLVRVCVGLSEALQCLDFIAAGDKVLCCGLGLLYKLELSEN